MWNLILTEKIMGYRITLTIMEKSAWMLVIIDRSNDLSKKQMGEFSWFNKTDRWVTCF